MNIAVVGTGYVGLVSGACLAEIGHKVSCVDIDEQKIRNLTAGKIPIYEPGLDTLVLNNVQAQRLSFTTSLPKVLPAAQVVIIAVGTPAQANGHADLQYVYAVAEQIADHIEDYKVIVDKSTVPVGTGREVEKIIRKKYQGGFAIVSCLEFLREGSAVEDFMHPDRIVIGTSSDRAAKIMLDVFNKIKGEKLVTNLESAELIKYASNAFLATKISFINEIAHLCERAGGDVEEVAYGVGLDSRIGPKFLQAGIGWGGSCFPKDVSALDQIGDMHGYDFRLLKAVIEVNNHQRQHLVSKIKEYFNGELKGRKIGVLGLAFKGNTDDIRESASIDIIKLLRKEGAVIQAFDYEATENARKILGEEQITYCPDPYVACAQAEVILLATEWPQFKLLDWKKIAQNMVKAVLFDGRNLLKPSRMREEYGFVYYSMGRNGEKEENKKHD